MCILVDYSHGLKAFPMCKRLDLYCLDNLSLYYTSGKVF